MCPSAHLAVHLYQDSLKSIQPTANQLRRGANIIIKDYVGNNAARKCTRRKLNSYGYLAGHCGVVNSEENMNRMKEQLVMADSVSEIHRKEAEDKVLEKLEKNKLNDEKAPVAIWKLEDKGREVVKITVAEIEPILFSVYNITMDGSKLRKDDCVSALEKEMATNIIKYECFVRNLETVPASEGTLIVCGDSCAESVDA